MFQPLQSGVRLATRKDAGAFTIYVDPTTISRKGDLVKMWVLYDFKFVQTIESKSYLSATWQQQFNCSEQRSRNLAYTYYSNNMGHGNVTVAGDDEGNKGSQVAPRSAAAILWNSMWQGVIEPPGDSLVLESPISDLPRCI